MNTKKIAGKPIQLLLSGISADMRIKLKLMALAQGVSIKKIIELMTERMWEENKNAVSNLTQQSINREVGRILEKLVPK